LQTQKQCENLAHELTNKVSSLTAEVDKMKMELDVEKNVRQHSLSLFYYFKIALCLTFFSQSSIFC